MNEASVMRLQECDYQQVRALLARFGLSLTLVQAACAIPGSFWGDDEAGLIGAQLYARLDTPMHSIFHEACHWITCNPQRRAQVHTDAADNQDEENATCYLQILLARELPEFGLDRALSDMDAWGYSFRLGSARQWFELDATAERRWLLERGLIDADAVVLFRVRETMN